MSAEAQLAHHFDDMLRQSHAARLGMWMFLATEILLFAGLFVAYGFYRTLFAPAFEEATHYLDLGLGTTNTVVLITSSFAVAMSLHFVRVGRKGAATLALAATIAMGFAFLAIKGVEYAHKFEEGALPGKYYTFKELQLPGASLFYTLYFLMTGLHAIHVTVGLGVLGWLFSRVAKGAYSAAYDTPLELGAMYWHLVDVIWIFLYPLLYLV